MFSLLWLSLLTARGQVRLWATIAICAAMSALVIGTSALVLAGHIRTRVRFDPTALPRQTTNIPVERAYSPI